MRYADLALKRCARIAIDGFQHIKRRINRSVSSFLVHRRISEARQNAATLMKYLRSAMPRNNLCRALGKATDFFLEILRVICMAVGPHGQNRNVSPLFCCACSWCRSGCRAFGTL